MRHRRTKRPGRITIGCGTDATFDAPAVGSTLVLDQFADPDGTVIGSHAITPTNRPGHSWVANAGTWQIQTNKLRKTANNNTHQTCTLDCGVSDCTVSADLQSP